MVCLQAGVQWGSKAKNMSKRVAIVEDYEPLRALWCRGIPTAPATQSPGQAVITSASSPAAGAVHFDYDAPHGTSWDVFRKGPGDAAFVKVASDVIVKSYDATGLAAGDYEFKVVGRNSKGDGPESAVSTITVG